MIPAVPDRLRGTLYADHERLDGLFSDLVAAADAGVDSRTLGALWAAFDRGVRAHFAVEEEEIFPRLVEAHAAEVAALQAEHEEIRALLDTVGLEVELHVVRSAAITRLVELLRLHAAREEAAAYRWADLTLAPTTDDVLRRVAGRLHLL